MNEKKLTAFVSVLAFAISGASLIPVTMSATEDLPHAAAFEETTLNEATDYAIELATELPPEEYIGELEAEYGTYYFQLENGEVTIAKYVLNDTVVIPEHAVMELPSEFQGMPVRRIKDYALPNIGTVEHVIIPEGITYIGDSFSNARMQYVTLPNSLEEINGGAFIGCKRLKTIQLPDKSLVLGSCIFASSGIESIEIPSSMSILPLLTFRGCTNLQTVVFPDTPLYVEDEAFKNTGLTEITVPSNVTLGKSVFAENTQLESITFAEGVAIPTGTLDGCTALRELSFSSAVTSLDHVLEESIALEHTYFSGSVDEWNCIDFSESDRKIIYNGNIHIDSYANLNGDMSIDAEDSFIILNASALAGSGMDSGLTEQQISDADVNFDGKYDAQDAATILQYAAAFGSGEKVTLADFLTE